MNKLLLLIGAAVTLALTADSAANSCIVSGSTERTAVVACSAVAINSEFDSSPAPEVRLVGLNMRTDEVCGFVFVVW